MTEASGENSGLSTQPTAKEPSSSKHRKLPHNIKRVGGTLWFEETETFWTGQKFALALEEFASSHSSNNNNKNNNQTDTPGILFHQHSGFQEILVFSSAQYGTTLALDGVIQLTERDEFSYHEMMTHMPLCSHQAPRRVLIVGGGDGGILREVVKHDVVEEIIMVEIDPLVIQVCRKYFGDTTAVAFDDPRLRVVHADAATYLEQHAPDYFDVILGDTSDPVGPAATLFQPDFYESMYAALKQGGIICMQAECFWIHLSLISDMTACCADIFDTAEYTTTLVPTYPCGQIGFLLASKGTQRSTLRVPLRIPDFVDQLRWYSPAQHTAAFTLPPFVERELAQWQTTDAEDADNEDDYRCVLEHLPSCALL